MDSKIVFGIALQASRGDGRSADRSSVPSPDTRAAPGTVAIEAEVAAVRWRSHEHLKTEDGTPAPCSVMATLPFETVRS